LMSQDRCARGDPVSFVEFLIIEREFRLVQANRLRRLAKIFLPANHANERECEASRERRFHHAEVGSLGDSFFDSRQLA